MSFHTRGQTPAAELFIPFHDRGGDEGDRVDIAVRRTLPAALLKPGKQVDYLSQGRRAAVSLIIKSVWFVCALKGGV